MLRMKFLKIFFTEEPLIMVYIPSSSNDHSSSGILRYLSVYIILTVWNQQFPPQYMYFSTICMVLLSNNSVPHFSPILLPDTRAPTNFNIISSVSIHQSISVFFVMYLVVYYTIYKHVIRSRYLLRCTKTQKIFSKGSWWQRSRILNQSMRI